MDQYRINDLERLSGVKAHTIRIWEKRYQLISPSRSSTNRRFYNGDQLKKLMNVATLLAHGHKISNVAACSDTEINKLLEQLHNSDSDEAKFNAYINDLTVAMVAFDEDSFNKVFKEVTEQYSFYTGMLYVFYPFLAKTGMLWRISKTQPIQEHFATSILRKKILSTIDNLDPPKVNCKSFLLFLSPNEWHEIGLLFADYLIRANGHKTYYMGQNVPYADVRDIGSLVAPDYILTFYISPKPKEEIEREISNLSKSLLEVEILVAGDKNLLSGNKYATDNVKYLKDVNSLLAFL